MHHYTLVNCLKRVRTQPRNITCNCYKINILFIPIIRRVLNNYSISLYKPKTKPVSFCQDCNYSWCPKAQGIFLERREYSLYLLRPENLLRRFAHHTIAQRWFDNSVLFFIALNCITLAMERPDIPPDSMVRHCVSCGCVVILLF